jgi:hypothetical protein
LPKGQAKSKIVPVRLSESEAAKFSKVASKKKLTLSEWIRSTLNSEAAK